MSRVVPDSNVDKGRLRRRSSLVQNILSFQRPPPATLDPEKFAELLSKDLTSGFDETSESFAEICTKAKMIMDSNYCYIFLIDNKEHKLYTYLKDEEGKEVKIMKPVDRGITGFVLSEEKHLNLRDIHSSTQWCPEIDDIGQSKTMAYLACPLWGATAGECVGVLEFRNSVGDKSKSFGAADEQMGQIVAFQVGRAFVHHRQQELLDGRNQAINLAYEKNFDRSDSISIEDEPPDTGVAMENISSLPHSGGIASLRRAVFKQRSAMTMGTSWKWKPSFNHSHLSDRDWGYDVFVYNEEQLIMHAVDIFDERGLFTNFSIPVTTFVNFVKELKSGYNSSAPYHNHYHAFDVMHVCYLLITRCKADDYLDSFNILSILVGALAHDLGHDGFNNAFHCTTNSELAVVYNGISVLENYSAAYLFRILRKDKCNIFARLDDTEITKMRARLIDLILDTDAKNHFTLMTRFKHSMEMKQLSRGLLSSMLLHVSDVSNPMRPGAIARKWAYAVQEEFFRQGDKEKELQLATSPFMDREFENLPRMQGAFIDALVTPVFKLLAELLPLVDRNCIKQLHINRSFWNSMQNQSIVTTDNIVAYLKGVRQETSSTEESKDSDSVSDSDPMGPIPGIPANAVKGNDQETVRKLSLVPIQRQNVDLHDLESGNLAPKMETSIVRTREAKCYRSCDKSIKKKANNTLHSAVIQLVLLTATIVALFANDLNLIVGSRETDFGVEVLILLVFFIFVIEMIISVLCVPKYTHFFLWLDLVASISLLLEVNFLLESGSSSTDGLSLAKASRAAKVGARAGRLAKLLRLLRLVKIAKVLKWMMGYRQIKENTEKEDADDEIGLKMSVVGRKMTESITKKVILTVMLMFAVFSLLETNFTPDGRQLQLDALALNPKSDLLREGFFRAHDNLIRLNGIGNDFINVERTNMLRTSEILTIESATNEQVLASFDLSNDVFISALFSLATTIIVTALLAVLSLLFSSDAYNIMIRPIEKMKVTVQRLSENPLLHLEKMRNRGGSTESNETDLLEQTITKMATLLQVGFGCAGAEIIANSLSAEGEVDPMVPGNRVHAIFGFCDIRNFTMATEHLQEDVMLFVNKLAHITHKHVVDSGGAPNKNIGDAFLLVWKLNSTKDGKRGRLQKHLFDSALSSFQNIIEDIKEIKSLAGLMQKDDHNGQAGPSSLEHFKVEMGFGLHTGWAIEGSIGSKVKVDASYLSPHVNLASRLEAATKQYGIPLLMSDVFVSGLTGSVQSTCRRVDRVVFKGCIEAMTIFHQDMEPFSSLHKKPKNYSDLLLATSWKGKEEIKKIGVDISETIKALRSDKTLLIREVYEIAFNAYVDGDWGKCKILFHLWLEKFPGDIIVQSLTDFLMSYNFECPSHWQGQHVLETK